MSGRWLFRRAGSRLRRAPGLLVGLTVAFSVVAALGAAADLLGREGERATGRLASNVHVVAYLDPTLPADRVESLAIAFGRLGGVSDARAIDEKAALGELKATLAAAGEPGDVLAGIEADFLPRSIEITLAAGHDLPGRAREVAARLRRTEGVSAVDAMADGLARVAAFGTLAGRLSALFTGVAALAALALLGGLVLRERSYHQELSETLHLLGARPLSVWLPIGLVDAICALVGGGLGLVLGAAITARALGAEAATLGWGGREMLMAMAALAALGIFTGWLSLPRARSLWARVR